MKRIIVSALVMTALFSCGGEKKDAATTAPEAPAAAANPLEDKALAIIGKSDCLTCHKISEKLIGPAYTDVAQKYENTDANVNMLIDKVIAGGKGNWGEIPMLAHSNIPKEDVKTVVQYILSLRKK